MKLIRDKTTCIEYVLYILGFCLLLKPRIVNTFLIIQLPYQNYISFLQLYSAELLYSHAPSHAAKNITYPIKHSLRNPSLRNHTENSSKLSKAQFYEETINSQKNVSSPKIKTQNRKIIPTAHTIKIFKNNVSDNKLHKSNDVQNALSIKSQRQLSKISQKSFNSSIDVSSTNLNETILEYREKVKQNHMKYLKIEKTIIESEKKLAEIIIDLMQTFRNLHKSSTIQRNFIVPNQTEWRQDCIGMPFGDIIWRIKNELFLVDKNSQLAIELKKLGLNLNITATQIRTKAQKLKALKKQQHDFQKLIVGMQIYKRLYDTFEIPYRYCVPSIKPYPSTLWSFNLGVAFHALKTGRRFIHITGLHQKLLKIGFDLIENQEVTSSSTQSTYNRTRGIIHDSTQEHDTQQKEDGTSKSSCKTLKDPHALLQKKSQHTTEYTIENIFSENYNNIDYDDILAMNPVQMNNTQLYRQVLNYKYFSDLSLIDSPLKLSQNSDKNRERLEDELTSINPKFDDLTDNLKAIQVNVKVNQTRNTPVIWAGMLDQLTTELKLYSNLTFNPTRFELEGGYHYEFDIWNFESVLQAMHYYEQLNSAHSFNSINEDWSIPEDEIWPKEWWEMPIGLYLHQMRIGDIDAKEHWLRRPILDKIGFIWKHSHAYLNFTWDKLYKGLLWWIYFRGFPIQDLDVHSIIPENAIVADLGKPEELQGLKIGYLLKKCWSNEAKLWQFYEQRFEIIRGLGLNWMSADKLISQY